MSPTTDRRRVLQALDAKRPSYRYDKNARKCRSSLRADIASSSYWSHLAPTADLVPDFLVVAWAELCNGSDDEAMGAWSELLHDWPVRPLRYIDHAVDLVGEYISIVTTGSTRSTAEASS